MPTYRSAYNTQLLDKGNSFWPPKRATHSQRCERKLRVRKIIERPVRPACDGCVMSASPNYVCSSTTTSSIVSVSSQNLNEMRSFDRSGTPAKRKPGGSWELGCQKIVGDATAVTECRRSKH